MEALLLRQRHFLRVETGKIRHLSFQLSQVHEGVDLVGKQDRLLLMHPSLVGRYLDKQVVGRDSAASRRHARLTTLVLTMHLRSAATVACPSADHHLGGP